MNVGRGQLNGPPGTFNSVRGEGTDTPGTKRGHDKSFQEGGDLYNIESTSGEEVLATDGGTG